MRKASQRMVFSRLEVTSSSAAESLWIGSLAHSFTSNAVPAAYSAATSHADSPDCPFSVMLPPAPPSPPLTQKRRRYQARLVQLIPEANVPSYANPVTQGPPDGPR